MKRILCFAVLISILLSAVPFQALADRKPIEKDKNYYGAMRVAHCKEWVSLREGPRKTYRRILKVPKGAIVMNCRYVKKGFVSCEYQGEKGYIMKIYLDPAPEYEPVETTGEWISMTQEEVAAKSDIILDWKEFNVSVLASRHYEKLRQSWKEVLRVGCYVDGRPAWGYVETVDNENGGDPLLNAFIGGDIDEPQVLVYDAEYGLIMLDLMSGNERWTLPKDVCPLGDAAAIAVAENGTMYIAGTGGPAPVAISRDGQVMWRSVVDGVEGCTVSRIKLLESEIEVHYEKDDGSGEKTVILAYNGLQMDSGDMD